MRLAVSAAIAAGLVIAGPAMAQSVKDCDASLIKGTYSSNDHYLKDWRLAKYVTESTYNSAKAEAGANAVIYGVPVGANYGQFQENIKNAASGSDETLKIEQFRNVTWTGLDENSSAAYSDCLRAISQQQHRMLWIVPVRATENDVTFRVGYSPIGNSPIPLPLRWQGSQGIAQDLPGSLSPGEETVVIQRPTTTRTLAVNGGGATADILLTPLPAPPPPDGRPSECRFDAPPPHQENLPNGSSATWLCPAIRPGTYTIAFYAKPTTSPAGIPVRVNYGFKVFPRDGSAERQVDLPTSNAIDINASAGLGDAFVSNGFSFAHSGGSVKFGLYIVGVAPHSDFSNPNGGTVVLPASVDLAIERTGD